MKFARCAWEKAPREVEMTPRRLAAIDRRLARERDAVALLPDLVAQVVTKDVDVARTQEGHSREHALWRAHRAKEWRAVRRRLAALPEHTRRGVLRYWDNWCASGNPGSPEYLATHVHSAERGVSFWTRLRVLRQLKLIGEGKLPKTFFFRPGEQPEPSYRQRNWRDSDREHFRQRRARKLGLVPVERQIPLGLTVRATA